MNPCCRSTDGYAYGSAHDQTIEQIWNGERARKMRLELLKDHALPQCQDCHRLEEIGGSSMRQDVNRRFQDAIARVRDTTEDGSVPARPFLFLDIRFSNRCNFRCRNCASKFSISWAEDEKKLGKQPSGLLHPTSDPSELREFLEKNVSSLERVYFAGGEPLLEDEHYVFLERLIAAGRTDIELSYNTNFSKLSYKNWDVLDLWSRFRKVSVGASLDGTGVQAEYLRKGMVWKQIEENFKNLRQRASHVTFVVYPTVSVMNLFHLPEAIRQWIRIGMIEAPSSLMINILREPVYLHMNVLSETERARLGESYAEFLTSMRSELQTDLYRTIENQLQQILKSFGAPSSTAERTRFAFETTRLDAVRGENFADLFPELSDLTQLVVAR